MESPKRFLKAARIFSYDLEFPRSLLKGPSTFEGQYIRTSAKNFNDRGEAVVRATGALLDNGVVDENSYFEAVLLLSPDEPLVVNSLGDAPDTNPGDGIGDTGGAMINGNPECTLRAALMEANASGKATEIKFDIPDTEIVDGRRIIRPMSPLPEIMTPVTLDATTMEQQTFDSVLVPEYAELDGASAGDNTPGLKINATGCIIKGL